MLGDCFFTIYPSEQVPPKQPFGGQQGIVSGLQLLSGGRHDAPACTAVGATIEVTSGMATIAARPSVRTIRRLLMPAILNAAGGLIFSSSSPSLLNCSNAYQTTFSSIVVSIVCDKSSQV